VKTDRNKCNYMGFSDSKWLCLIYVT